MWTPRLFVRIDSDYEQTIQVLLDWHATTKEQAVILEGIFKGDDWWRLSSLLAVFLFRKFNLGDIINTTYS